MKIIALLIISLFVFTGCHNEFLYLSEQKALNAAQKVVPKGANLESGQVLDGTEDHYYVVFTEQINEDPREDVVAYNVLVHKKTGETELKVIREN